MQKAKAVLWSNLNKNKTWLLFFPEFRHNKGVSPPDHQDIRQQEGCWVPQLCFLQTELTQMVYWSVLVFMLCVYQTGPCLLTLLWMALLLEGCTSTLWPAAVISFTCCGARGARLSHTVTSSRRIAITLLWWLNLCWLHTQPFTLLLWPLTSRSMAHPGKVTTTQVYRGQQGPWCEHIRMYINFLNRFEHWQHFSVLK